MQLKKVTKENSLHLPISGVFKNGMISGKTSSSSLSYIAVKRVKDR